MSIREIKGVKLRLRDNSLRLRLSQTEVATVAGAGEISSATLFGSNALTVRLHRSGADHCAADFDGKSITVSVPGSRLERWARTQQVSIEAEQALPGGEALRILIEKDFACLSERPGEDDSDAYPHPDEAGGSCSGG